MSDLEMLLRPTADALMCWGIETTLVASVLAVIALLATRIRRIGPAVRHTLWLVVLIKLMTPPLVYWPWSRPLPLTSSNSSIIERSNQNENDSRDSRRRARTNVARILRRANFDEARPDFQTQRSTVTAARKIERGPVDLKAEWKSRVPQRIGVCLASVWLFGSLVVSTLQAKRTLKLRRVLRGSYPALQWLIDEATSIGERLGVGIPEIRVVNGSGSPFLWCLGRPVLVVPLSLLDSFEIERWRAILAHELAHIRRGDPWVSRLEFAAALVWWWSPLFWLTRARLDFEAEVACDAWVLWALPEDRLGYAESLVRICTSLSSARSTSPALGVAGSGRSFERRLIMILRESVSRNTTVPGIAVAALLTGLSLPSWIFAGTATLPTASSANAKNPAFADPVVVQVAMAADEEDDDDDDAPRPAKKKAVKAPKIVVKKKKEASKIKEKEDDTDEKVSPELEKKMEALSELGEKLGDLMEKKFGSGSDFETKMEAIGEAIEKKMEVFEEEIEKKFGPDFEKKMEALGSELEKSFGPGSDFMKEISSLGETLSKQFGPGSEFADSLKDLVNAKPSEKAPASPKMKPTKPTPEKVAEPKKLRRADRIEKLESRIEEMMRELERLKADPDEAESES